jgi:hypothetical protein
MIDKIRRFFKWWTEESAKQCPHCGYFCNDSTIWCAPPIVPEPKSTVAVDCTKDLP